MKKNKAFTLIELIAVLVIMAILALIVTPLVMNIIRKARISADKRSIDAYGRSIELAIASYLLDNGYFPTSIEQLTIEYSGDEVVCSTTQLKSDSSVYLAECTVGGRKVENYTYGSDKSPTYDAYSVGDEVRYNNVDYYVIKDSGAKEDTITLLKAEPLSYEDVHTYSLGTGAQISNYNDYGGMEYHSESNTYATSYVKHTVDAWKTEKAPAATEARLFTIDEVTSFGYELFDNGSIQIWQKSESTPVWLYSNYHYWTGSQYNDSMSGVWVMTSSGDLISQNVTKNYSFTVVRPVITISKSVL